MTTNTNRKTGLGYGVINANHVSMEALDVGGAGWVNVDELNYIADIKKKLVAWLNDPNFNSVKAAAAVDMKYHKGYADTLADVYDCGPIGDVFTEDDLDDDVMQPIYDGLGGGADTWEYADDQYHLLYDSNENILWVMDSPCKALVRPTFQGCYPNCGDLDRGDEDYGFFYHALGLEYFDDTYAPCPYIPVPIKEE